MGKRKALGSQKQRPKRQRTNIATSLDSGDRTTVNPENIENNPETPTDITSTLNLENSENVPEVPPMVELQTPLSVLTIQKNTLEQAEDTHNQNEKIAENRDMTVSDTAVHLHTDEASLLTSDQPGTSNQKNDARSTIEVIDLDDLPDLPDSPIGDDVVEIEPPEEKNQPRSKAGFVDLTDDQSPCPNKVSTKNHFKENSDPVVTNESENESDDLPLVSLKKQKETSKYSGTRIVCPVCQDDSEQIKKDSRKLTSTVCGHIFCDTCVKRAIQVQQKCPTCRRKLKKSQFHPIFL